MNNMKIEMELPSITVMSAHGDSMEVRGGFSISLAEISVFVETIVHGEIDTEACYGSTFSEVFSQLDATNYDSGAFLAVLRTLPEWGQIERRIAAETSDYDSKNLQAIKERADRTVREEAWLGQDVAQSGDGRFRMAWRRVWYSERAVEVVVSIDGKQHAIADLSGGRPFQVAFDERGEVFEGRIRLPAGTGSPTAACVRPLLYRFAVGVAPLELKYLRPVQDGDDKGMTSGS